MKNNWLWDRKISNSQARKILKHPEHKDFFLLAALYLARNNEPGKALKEYISPLILCKHWMAIKKRMRKDKWSQPRIVFWQAIYDKLMEKYRNKGISFRKAAPFPKNPLCERIGTEIRAIRHAQNISQKQFAKRLGVSQHCTPNDLPDEERMISRVENLHHLAVQVGHRIGAHRRPSGLGLYH